MKKGFLLLGLLMMIFLVGGVLAENQTCAKEGESFSQVYKEYPEKCCEGLTEWDSGMDTRVVQNGTCKETGMVAGNPVGTCIKCGDGICGLNENVCNCVGDCKSGCENRGDSCCKNGVCLETFYDGLPSACSNGNLPEFSGCDADCKPVVECKLTNETCVKAGEAYYPGTEKCCAGLESIFGSENPDGTCSCTEKDNNCGGAPICAPCGNGKCEGDYGEDKCNCTKDCKNVEVNTSFFQKIINWFRNLFG